MMERAGNPEGVFWSGEVQAGEGWRRVREGQGRLGFRDKGGAKFERGQVVSGLWWGSDAIVVGDLLEVGVPRGEVSLDVSQGGFEDPWFVLWIFLWARVASKLGGAVWGHRSNFSRRRVGRSICEVATKVCGL